MKNYDYKKAKQIISKFTSVTDVICVYIGMSEDWFWTATCVWENGEYKKELPDNADELEKSFLEARANGLSMFLKEKDENGLMKSNPEWDKFTTHLLGGLYGSSWATPVIEIELANGEKHTFNCYNQDGEDTLNELEKIEKMLMCTSGVLSAPIRDSRIGMDIKDFKDQ